MEFFQKAKGAVNCKKKMIFSEFFSEIRDLNFGLKVHKKRL
jgi:hypothetical protein